MDTEEKGLGKSIDDIFDEAEAYTGQVAETVLEEQEETGETKTETEANAKDGEKESSETEEVEGKEQTETEEEEPAGEKQTEKEKEEEEAGKEAEAKKKEQENEPVVTSRLSEAFPDEKFESPDQVSEKIDHLITDSQNLAKEREANQKVYALFESSEEMVEVARHLNKGRSFMESVALTVDIEQTMKDLKESDPAEYRKVVKAQVEREQKQKTQRERAEKLQEEFAENEEASEEVISGFQKEHKLSDKDKEAFLGTVNGYFGDLVKGKITPQFLQVMHRGLNYEQALEKAREEGRIEGRNEKIETKKGEKTGDSLPVLGGGGKSRTTSKEEPDIFDDALAPRTRISEIQ